MLGFFGKSVVDSSAIFKYLDSLSSMIKSKKFKKIAFASTAQQLKPYSEKFQMILNGIDQWLKQKDTQKDAQMKKILAISQNQSKLREENLIQLLNQCRTNININPAQFKQKIKDSFFNIQNCELFIKIISEIINKNKNLSLIQQKLKEGSKDNINSFTIVSNLLEEVKQNKAVLEAYEKVISPFINFPNQLKFPSYMLTIKDKKRQSQIQNNCAKMFQLYKAITSINEQLPNSYGQLVKVNSITQAYNNKSKSNKQSSWEQLLVKPILIMKKQNQQTKPQKTQYDLAYKIIGYLGGYKFDKFSQNILKCDLTLQQRLRKIKKELQQPAAAAKNINKRMTAILTRSNFINESQLQPQSIQKLQKNNLIFITNEKRMIQIQDLITLYEDLMIKIRKIEVVKKKISNKNKRYTLKEQIDLIMKAIEPFQSSNTKQINNSPQKQKKTKISPIVYQKIQSIKYDNSQNLNQYPQQIQKLIKNWIELCKIILQAEDSIHTQQSQSCIQYYELYINQFDEIVAEVKRLKTNLYQQQKKNTLLTQKNLKQEKNKTQFSLHSFSADLYPGKTFSAEDMNRIQISYLQMCDQIGVEQRQKKQLIQRSEKLMQQKKKIEGQVSTLTSNLINQRNLQQIKSKQNNELKQQNNSLKNKILKFQKDIAKLKQQIFFSKSQINNLQKTKDFIYTNVAKLESELQSAKNQITNLTNDAVQLNSNYIKEKQNKQKIIFKKSNQEQQAKVENNKLIQQLKSYKEDYQTTKAQLIDKTQSQEKIYIDNINLKDEVKRISEKNQGLMEIIANQQNQIKQLNENIYLINQQKQKYFTKQNQRYTLFNQNVKTNEQLRQLNNKFQTQIKELQQIIKNNINFETKFHEKRKELNKLKQQEQKYQKFVQEMEKIKNQLKQSLVAKEQFESQIKLYINKQAERQTQNQRKESQMQKAIAEIAKLNLTNNQQQSSLRQFQQNVSAINQRSQNLQRQLSRLKQAQIQIRKELDTCKDRLKYVDQFLKSQIFNELPLNNRFFDNIKVVYNYISYLKNQVNVQRLYAEEYKKKIDYVYQKNKQKIQMIQAFYKQSENILKTEIEELKIKLIKLNEFQQKICQSQTQILNIKANNQQSENKLNSERFTIQQQLIKFKEMESKYIQSLLNKEKQNNQLTAKIEIMKSSFLSLQNSLQERLSDLIGQLKDKKRQMQGLTRQLSELLNFCKTNKQEEQHKTQIFNGMKQIISSTLIIQGLAGNFQRFVSKSNELKSNKKLAQFLQEIQQNIANLNEKCVTIKEIDYTSCINTVIEQLKLLCRPQEIMHLSYISNIGYKEQVSTNSFIGLLEQH